MISAGFIARYDDDYESVDSFIPSSGKYEYEFEYKRNSVQT